MRGALSKLLKQKSLSNIVGKIMPKITTADDKLQGKGRSNIEKMKKKKKTKKNREELT